MAHPVASQLDPLYLAQIYFRQRKFDECISVCTALLDKNPYDQAPWALKLSAMTEKFVIDDTEMDDEGIAEVLMDDNAISQVPRPGTSLQRPSTTAAGQRPTTSSQSFRPMSASGRPVTGFVRADSTPARKDGPDAPGSSRGAESALRGPRPTTSRPVTSASGRFARIGTASMLADPNSKFINIYKLDMEKYASRPALARVLFDYIYYCENNVQKALELAAKATEKNNFKDWWWKLQLGKCYYRLGLLRDAEKQYKSSLKDQEMSITYRMLGKLYIRLDQPKSALEQYAKALDKFPGQVALLTAKARVYEALQQFDESEQAYKDVLVADPSNVEAIATLAAHHFYQDQPEIALRLYRRLLQMGVYNAEIFNNLGLCCFYGQQYDMALSCFERALNMANDKQMGDVWYNLGQVSVAVGDTGLAYLCFKLAVTTDPNHAEAFNNLGVLELKKANLDVASSNFQAAQTLQPFLHEPHYNRALLSFRMGELEQSAE
eukprot:Colp12_sorted_trinity150504_noHs@13675